jgi:putative intracellular protease/amidase
MEKILVVLSGANRLELARNRSAPTGFWLNELVVPAWGLAAAGYELVVATPDAKRPALDECSDKARYFGNDPQKLQAAHNFVLNHPAMRSLISLHDAASRAAEFAAVYIPGGHAPIVDLVQNRDLGRILREFLRAAKPIAALCHGPVALLSALPNPAAYRRALVAYDLVAANAAAARWPFAGYHMTAFSDEEEDCVEAESLQGQLPFYAAGALSRAGAKIEHGPPFEARVVEDRGLVTGQNPASAEALTRALLDALAQRKSRAVA